MTSLPNANGKHSLAHHVSRLLPLSENDRQNYLAPLDAALTTDLRELLEFESTAIDLSQAAGVTLARELLQRDPPEKLGRWSVVRQLGQGGMGSVYLVTRQDLGVSHQAAAKLGYVQPASDATLAAIQREAKALSRLQHANIASLLDYGIADAGMPFVVFEYVDGDELLEFAHRNGLTRTERLRLFVQLLDGVAFAHSRLVLHLDIKPQNVLVTNAGTVKLIDFGLSGIMGVGDAAGDQGVATGYTQAYASPEQRSSAPVTVRSDTYSLGLLLHELVFGNLPKTDQSSKYDRTDGELLAVIQHAIQEDPELRYASAIEFKHDIEAVLSHRPVSPWQHQRLYRWRKLVRRHWLPMALAGSTAIALVAGLVGIGLQYRATIVERDRALMLLESEKATSDFITKSLRTASVFGGGDADTTVGEMLRHMVTTLPDAEKMSDRAIAWLAGDLAAVLTGLGEMDLALEACELAVTHAALSSEIEDDIAHWTQLALTAGQAHEYAIALNAAERARELAEPINHWRLPWAHLARMQTLVKMKRWADVEALWPVVKAIPTERLSVQGNIDYMRGTARIHLGNFEGAAADLKRAKSLYAGLFGERSVPVADVAFRQFELQRVAGKAELAAQLVPDLQALFLEAYGEAHYRLAILTGEIGILSFHRGNGAAATTELTTAIDQLSVHRRPPVLALGYYRVQLARVLAAQGRLWEAEAVLDEALNQLSRLDAAHPDRINAAITRAELSVLRRQPQLGQSLFEQALSLLASADSLVALKYRVHRGLGFAAIASGDIKACRAHRSEMAQYQRNAFVPPLALDNNNFALPPDCHTAPAK